MIRRHKKKIGFMAALLWAAIYFFWAGFAPDLSEPSRLFLNHTESFGSDSGRGNVVGIEPYMQPLDYATPARFKAKIAGYLDAARGKGWIKADTVVLLPEHIGTWLMTVNQGSRIYSAANAQRAMLPIIASHLPAFLKNYYIFDNKAKAQATIIRAQTRTTADAVLRIFSELAKEYSITIVAGSQALMTPGVYPDSLTYGHGPIFNSSFVFSPDGQAQIDAVRKVHPIPSETGFTQASLADFLPVFEGPHRKFSVLICADSWFDDTNTLVAERGAELLLVPSFLEGTAWDTPWQGYLNDGPPDGIWRADIGKISEGDAWIKYALPAQAKKHGIKWGMNVFLKGKLWEWEGFGRAIILENGVTHIGKAREDEAALYNLWLQ